MLELHGEKWLKETIFEAFSNKFAAFELHHQMAFTIIIAISIITFSWGVEKLLEKFLFPQKPIYGYVIAIIGGLILLWLTKFIVSHAEHLV